MGTPDFAAVVLQRLLAWNGADIVAAYCQPDKKAGRGMRLVPPPVKKLALERGIPVFQPASLKNAEDGQILKHLEPDFLAVASYGLILPQDTLDAAKIAPLNVHASLLPAYRGAAPIQRAMLENYGAGAKTGVSIMKMTAGLDSGPVYMRKTVEIGAKTYPELAGELAETGAEALVETMEKLLGNEISPVEQDDSLASYAHKLERKDAILDFSKSAAEIDAHVRALNPWPGAKTTFFLEGSGNGLPVAIISGQIGPLEENAAPGTILRRKDGLSIACGEGCYKITSLRPEGRNEMKSADFANGRVKTGNGVCGQAKSLQ